MKIKASRLRYLFFSKNFIMMLVALVVIIVAVSAWFVGRVDAEAQGISVRTSNSGIDIAPCIKVYNDPNDAAVYDSGKEKYTPLSEGPGIFQSELVFQVDTIGQLVKDCTGNGSELIVPEFNVTKDYNSVRKNGGKEVNLNLGASYAKSNLDAEQYLREHPDQDAPGFEFFEFEFYVRAKESNLKLKAQSRVISETEASGKALSDTTGLGGKKSEYGNFNVDGLVGAIRVALIGSPCTGVTQNWKAVEGSEDYVLSSTTAVTGTATQQFFWLPRPDVHLNVTPSDDDISTWTLDTDVKASDYDGDSYKASYYVKNGNEGVTLVDNDDTAKVSSGTCSEGSLQVMCLGNDVGISDFSEQPTPISLRVNSNNAQTEDYFVTKYQLRVWIEGADTEARRAMDGGKFSIKLFFE